LKNTFKRLLYIDYFQALKNLFPAYSFIITKLSVVKFNISAQSKSFESLQPITAVSPFLSASLPSSLYSFPSV